LDPEINAENKSIITLHVKHYDSNMWII